MIVSGFRLQPTPREGFQRLATAGTYRGVGDDFLTGGNHALMNADEIASKNRKIIAIAMEDYGFSRAAWQSPERVRHVVFRGICDDGSVDKDDTWHKYAARSAAAFAKHFLLDRP